MGWAKSASTGRRRTMYAVTTPASVPLREPAAPMAGDPVGVDTFPDDQTPSSTPADGEGKPASRRNRQVLPVYDVATGEDLETPVNLDNTLLQAMFPDLAIAMGQVPPPPPCPRGKDPDQHMQEHWQSALGHLSKDLAGQACLESERGNPLALDIATGGRKEGRFMFTDGQVGRLVADTFEKIMAYGGLLASPCLQPPKFVEGVRVLVVKEGEMGTGDCAGKMSRRLAVLWGKDGSEAGQFRLGMRLDEDTILVGKGTLKAMDRVDVDAKGRGYDLIVPDSSFKGNCPAFGEHTWDVHLGFNAWSVERRTRLSYQILQWFDPELVEQCIFPRADRKIPILLEATKDRDSACRFLRLEREDREAEVVENERGELETVDTREPAVLEEVLLADTTGQVFEHPYVQTGLRRRLREAWHELAVGGGVKVPSFMGLPDSFRGAVDWLPEGCIVCPDLPPGEVLATRYPIRTRHDIQVWRNLDWHAAFQMMHEGHSEMRAKIDALAMRSFFRYAERHQGVVFMSHGTAKRVGGDFDGDVFQVMPVTPYKPLDEIKNPNHDWSDLVPLVDQVRREGWGEQGTTTKVKRRLATHVAPERPVKVNETNRRWLTSAAIYQG
ncbi:MAG: hypothetical protein JXA93_11100, partial [Anaerolineae bacterium]|nr:hypothetical protein [Anaerolineae bacterium]